MTTKGKSSAADKAAVSSKGKKKAAVESADGSELSLYGAIAVRRAEETGQQVAWSFDEMLRQVTCMTVPAEDDASRGIALLRQVVLLPGINAASKEEGPRPARVMLVGSWPNTAETQACRLMHGDWVAEFEALSLKSGFPSDCYYTTFVKHGIDGKKAAVPKDLVDSFTPALKREIELVNPEMVVLLGSKVLKAVLGSKTTADSLKGRTLSAEESPLGVRTAAVMDFSSIQYAPENRGPIGLELSRLASELAGPGQVQEKVETEYIYCRGVQHLRDTVDRIRQEAAGFISVDCEWGGSNPQDGWLRCVQFSWAPGKALVAVLHGAGKTPTELQERHEETWAEIRRLVKGLGLVAHFIRADLPWLQHHGVDIELEALSGWDTGLAGHLLDENWPQGLENYIARHTDMGRYDLPLSQWIKASKYDVDTHGYGGIPDEILEPYAAADADGTFRIFLIQQEEMSAPGNERISSLFRDIVMPATLPILEMENTGMLVDRDRLVLLAQKYTAKRDELAHRLRELLQWPEFNPDSPAQKALAMFGWSKPGKEASVQPGVLLRRFVPVSATDGRKWEEVARKPESLKTASPSTDKETLTSLRLEYPDDLFLEAMQLYSAVSQTVKSFTGSFQEDEAGVHSVDKGLLAKIWPDGRIHCRIRQTIETGRYGHSDPNMAQMPKTAEGLVMKAFKGDPSPPPPIRSCFTERDGWCLVDCDWKQAELFVMAWLSGDTNMQVKLSDPDADFHSEVAVDMFKLERPPEGYSKGLKDWLKERGWIKFRTIAKTIVFGIAYGRGAAAVAGAVRLEGIDISLEEAQGAVDKFKTTFPDLAAWLESQQGAVLSKGYVENGFGRRRRFEPTADREMIGHQKRQAMNAPIQGTVGDLMSLALVNMYLARRFEKPHLRFRILMSVHDQILVGCPVEEVEETLEVISTAMCERCRIPGSDLLLSIDPEVCVRWGEPLSDEDVARYPSLAKHAK
jgi:uracil-DNA glycosylase family 4